MFKCQFIMPPPLKKVGGRIASGLSVRLIVHSSRFLVIA